MYGGQIVVMELVCFAIPIVVAVSDSDRGQVTIHRDRPLGVAVHTDHIGWVTATAHKQRWRNARLLLTRIARRLYYLPLRENDVIIE